VSKNYFLNTTITDYLTINNSKTILSDLMILKYEISIVDDLKSNNNVFYFLNFLLSLTNKKVKISTIQDLNNISECISKNMNVDETIT